MALTEEQAKAHRDWMLVNLERWLRSWLNDNSSFNSWDDAIAAVQNIIGTNNNNDGYTSSYVAPTTYTNTTYTPFSTLDTLNMQSQAWADADPDIASAYKNLASWLWSYSGMANTIADFYNTAAKQIADREWAYANASFQLADQLNQDLANQRDYIWSVFGPEGSLTTEMNKYYDDMWNYLASEWGRQMAKVAAQWLHSWASLWLLRAQENRAYNEAFANYLKVKEQEINAKQKIQAQLIDYMTKLRAEYGNTTNQYILAQYQRANDLLNKLSTDLASQYTNIGLARLQWTWSWSGSSSSSWTWIGSWTGTWTGAWTGAGTWTWIPTTAEWVDAVNQNVAITSENNATRDRGFWENLWRWLAAWFAPWAGAMYLWLPWAIAGWALNRKIL